jgi:hypothetical protein
MRALRIGPTALAVLTFALLQLTSPDSVSAQAWVPGKGWGSVSIGYKNLYVQDHLDMFGNRFDKGQIRTQVVSMDVDYGVSRRLAVNVGLPLNFLKYTGTSPHTADGIKVLDDGKYHGGPQDFRFGLRYSLVRTGPVMITPFAEGIVPSHDYITFAHAAQGRGLRELLVGTNLGWQGGEGFLSKAFAQTRINYSFVEKVLGRSHNRTNIDAEVGYFLTRRLAVTGIASYAKNHGGLDWDSTKGRLQDQVTPEEYLKHDELMRSDQLDVGGGGSFLINRSTSVYANVLTMAWGINGHALNMGVIVGVNFRFRSHKPNVSPNLLEQESAYLGSTIPPIIRNAELRTCH